MPTEIGRSCYQYWSVQLGGKSIERDKEGLTAGLGGDNHLAVLLEPYASTVGCEDAVVPITRQSCATIERGMEADERPRVFGDETLDPEVEEHLPYELISSEAFTPSLPPPAIKPFGKMCADSGILQATTSVRFKS